MLRNLVSSCLLLVHVFLHQVSQRLKCIHQYLASLEIEIISITTHGDNQTILILNGNDKMQDLIAITDSDAHVHTIKIHRFFQTLVDTR